MADLININEPPGGDPVQWARVVGPNAGDAAWEGKEGFTAEWQVHCYAPDAPPFLILRSPKLPQRGDALYVYRPTAEGYTRDDLANVNYKQFGLVTDKLAVANVTLRQHEDSPFLWRVSVTYEGVGDPTLQPSEVSSESREYQTAEMIDALGRAIENSARDPIMGGMPVERTQKYLRITRNVPWSQWDMRRGNQFENTLNLHPFPLSRQKDADGNPVELPRGTVRIKRFSEQEVVRQPSAGFASRSSFWRVTCELHIDERKIRMSDGTEQATLHRWTVADAGFRELNALGQPSVIYQGSQPATEQQFLDGKGRALIQRENPPPATESLNTPVRARKDTFTTRQDTPLAVPPPGVLLNDDPLAVGELVSDPSHGTLVFNPDGSFTYTPAAGYTGWDQFKYKAKIEDEASNPTSVLIYVVPKTIPVWLLFDGYLYADWSPLAAVLSNW